MTWFRKTPPPARIPHPDPARELELQRILDLRASIARHAELIRRYREDIGDLHDTAQDETSAKRAELYFTRADALHQRITETEAEISRVNEEIASLKVKLPAHDLAYL